MGDREDRPSGVSSLRPVGAQLFEVARGCDAGFFLQFACCGLLGLFALAQKAAATGMVRGCVMVSSYPICVELTLNVIRCYRQSDTNKWFAT